MILRKGVNENGILIFNPEISAEHLDYHAFSLDSLYIFEQKHFWFKARMDMIQRIFCRYIPCSSSILEIGSGTGSVGKYLLDTGYNNITLSDVHVNGLEYAKKLGITRLYQFDLFNAPFSEEFDVINMFDVLEHLNNDSAALECVHGILKKNGKICLTVPAHQWLWSKDDARACHKRRYTINSLKKVVAQSGFRITYCRYIFTSILPLLWLRKFIDPDDNEPIDRKKLTPSLSINPVINWLILKICLLENKLTKFIPNIAGGSIILVAEKI